METKLTIEQLNTKKQYWEYNQGLAVSSIGKSDGVSPMERKKWRDWVGGSV